MKVISSYKLNTDHILTNILNEGFYTSEDIYAEFLKRTVNEIVLAKLTPKQRLRVTDARACDWLDTDDILINIYFTEEIQDGPKIWKRFLQYDKERKPQQISPSRTEEDSEEPRSNPPTTTAIVPATVTVAVEDSEKAESSSSSSSSDYDTNAEERGLELIRRIAGRKGRWFNKAQRLIIHELNEKHGVLKVSAALSQIVSDRDPNEQTDFFTDEGKQKTFNANQEIIKKLEKNFTEENPAPTPKPVVHADQKGEFDVITRWQGKFYPDHVGEKGAELPTAGQLHSFDNSISFKDARELLKAYKVKLNEVTRRRRLVERLDQDQNARSSYV